jgi:hypothetical protein
MYPIHMFPNTKGRKVILFVRLRRPNVPDKYRIRDETTLTLFTIRVLRREIERTARTRGMVLLTCTPRNVLDIFAQKLDLLSHITHESIQDREGSYSGNDLAFLCFFTISSYHREFEQHSKRSRKLPIPRKETRRKSVTIGIVNSFLITSLRSSSLLKRTLYPKFQFKVS